MDERREHVFIDADGVVWRGLNIGKELPETQDIGIEYDKDADTQL